MYKSKHIERKWVFRNIEPVSSDFREHLAYPELILQTLVRRGLTNPDDALKFIDFTKYIPGSPYQLPDMEKGVSRVVHAIRHKDKIGVWGDFDVDGQTSTAILTSTLRDLDANYTYHIPIRGPETHGISIKALKEFLASGVKVILTCDTGSTAHEAIDYAQQAGIDVVVTDHHLLSETPLNAHSLINPRCLPNEHPLSTLPGAGTAYKFAEALYEVFDHKNAAGNLHDLAALGIIADLAELRGDARYLVQAGISQIRTSPRQALAAMLKTAEVDPTNLTEEQISFILAPRLNAVGRLSDANPIVDFLLSQDPSKIAVTLNQIEGLNSKRKLLCDQVFSGAQSLIDQNPAVLDYAVLVLHHPDWPAGVVGIVASRLVEIYHRPVLLLSGSPNEPIRGSARSVKGIDITAALRKSEKYLIGYGGHPMAAGLSLNPDNLPALIRALDANVQDMELDREISEALLIDQSMYPAEVTLDLARSLDLLAPYGPGNESLVFSAEGLQLINSKTIGKLGEHLLVDVEDSVGNLSRFIWWNGNGLQLPEGRFDLAYTPRASNYRGEDQVSLEWIDYRLVNDEIDSIKLSSNDTWENIDLRNSPSQFEEIKQMQDDPQTLVWVEGTAPADIRGFSRLELHSCHNLVLWSIPPNLDVLNAILRKTNPKHVDWVLVAPSEHELKYFLVQLVKVLKSNLAKGQQEFHLDQLASILAVNDTTIETAVRWLVAKGTISVDWGVEGNFSTKLGGTAEPIQQKKLEDALQHIFREMKAFSRYLLQADLDRLSVDLR